MKQEIIITIGTKCLGNKNWKKAMYFFCVTEKADLVYFHFRVMGEECHFTIFFHIRFMYNFVFRHRRVSFFTVLRVVSSANRKQIFFES